MAMRAVMKREGLGSGRLLLCGCSGPLDQDAWVLLHLSSSILTSRLTARSESARYDPSLPCTRPDPSQLGMIRVRVIPGPIRVFSFLIRVMIRVTRPDPSQP